MSLPEMIAQLVLPIKALATISLGARVAVRGMLLHVPAVLSRPTKDTFAAIKTLCCVVVWRKGLRSG